jgi:RNA polymerase sigma factor FliA
MTVEAGCSEESRVAAGRTRDEIILEHLPQVRLIAKRIRDRLPMTISLDDLISAGTVGLISAVDHYKASHDVKLKTYAEYKIRGAILDSLRVMDWAPRRQRKRSKLIENAITLLEQRLQRAPAEEEIAAELGLPIAEYQEWLSETRGLSLTRLERSGSEENRADVLLFVADPAESSPAELLERAELERALAQVIERLPALERTVLSLYYYEELTLREIARVVELHESRVSQLKSQGILRLRAYVERRWGPK